MGEKLRKLAEKRLVVATHNPGKLIEINALLAPYRIEAVSAGALGLDDPEETGKTFAENAAIKAHAAAKAADLPALADDSGLAVTALGGAPGIYSARWAGADKDFAAAMAKVEKGLKDTRTSDFSAKFVCALCLAWPDGREAFFTGEVRGTLTFPPRGDQGFGYDPIFAPDRPDNTDGPDKTFAEMDPSDKQALSHRARAFKALEAAVLIGR